MNNVFDQFDTVESVNVFDQFDQGTEKKVAEAAPVEEPVSVESELLESPVETDLSIPQEVAGEEPKLYPTSKEESLPERSFMDTTKDIGITALKGAINVPEAIVGLLDIPTFGHAGKFAKDVLNYDAKTAKKILDTYYSEPQKAAIKSVEDAEGFWGTLKAVTKNPSVAAQMTLESLPTMGAGGAIAKGIGTAAKVSPWIAAAIGEGVIGAGLAAEGIRQETEDQLLTGKQSLMAVGSGIGTGAFNLIGGRLAKKFGATDIDTLLAGGKATVPKGVAKGIAGKAKEVGKRLVVGGISEGLIEELPQSVQEQLWSNAALGRPLIEGVKESAALGLIVGSMTGAGVNVVSLGSQDTTEQEIVDEKKEPVAEKPKTDTTQIPKEEKWEPTKEFAKSEPVAEEKPSLEKVKKPPLSKSERQQKAVAEIVEELGSLEKVKRLYTIDDKLSRDARTLAAEKFGGDANLEVLTKKSKALPVSTGYEVQGRRVTTDGEVLGWDKKWQAAKTMKVAAQKSGANVTEFDVVEGDNGWVFQRREVKAPVEKRKTERKVPESLKDKVISTAKAKALKQAEFQESLKEEEVSPLRADKNTPEKVKTLITKLNKTIPEHGLKYDDIMYMPEPMQSKPDHVQITMTKWNKPTSVNIAVDKLTVEEIQRVVEEKEKEFGENALGKQEKVTKKPDSFPKTISAGPMSFKTTPINDTLYHETDIHRLTDLLSEALSNNSDKGYVGQLFVTNDKSLAIGQGTHKGVKIKFNGEFVSGKEHKKPGTGIIGGNEFVANFIGKDAIQEFTVPKGSKLKGLAKVFTKRFFNSEVLENGTVRYTKKGLQQKEPKITEKKVTKTPEVKLTTLGKPGYKKGKLIPWKMEHYAKKAAKKKGKGWGAKKVENGWVIEGKEATSEKVKVSEAPKEEKPVTYYHGTSKANAKKIIAEGFKKVDPKARFYTYSQLGEGVIYGAAKDSDIWFQPGDGRRVTYEKIIPFNVKKGVNVKVINTVKEADNLAKEVGFKDLTELEENLFFDGYDFSSPEKYAEASAPSKAAIKKLKAKGIDGIDFRIDPKLDDIIEPQVVIFDPNNIVVEKPKTSKEEKKSDLLKPLLNEKGSVDLSALEDLGKSLYTGGKQKYFDWQKSMKKKVGDAWEKVKGHLEKIWKVLKSPLKGEEGSVTVPSTITKTLKSAGRLTDEFLGAISTRLGNIDPSIKNRMRAYELDSALKAEKATKMVLPFIEKVSKMSKKDYKDFDLARKNRDAEEIARLSEKYGLENELTEVRTLLDALLKEAVAVGYNAKRLNNYHPREVMDLSGLLDYEHGNDNWSVVEEVIKNKERKLGRSLTKEEEIKLTNSLFRGYADERITLSKPGQLKLRRIQTITEERNKFYSDSSSALLRYVYDVVLAVEAKKLFGSSKNKGIDIDDTIGAYILKLSKEKKISPSQARDVRSILKARFDPVGTSGAVTTFKNLTLIDVMGSFHSAATQVGDMAWALYESGVIEATKTFPKALARKSRFTKEDLGISKIGAEFSDKSTSSKMVDTVFKATGLTTVDAMGKEILINSAYNKAVKKSLAKDQSKWKKELTEIFGKDADKIIDDFANKRDTRNTKLYMLHKLSDFQPATLSELPEGFLKGGNWRILYMLKSFDIKKFDVYRREVFQQIAKPGIKGKLTGLKNLVKLAMFITAMEATADVIKDLLSGKEVVLSDLVVQNIAGFFISRYRRGQMMREGVGTGFVKQIVPPFKAINALGKDILTAGDKKGLEITKSIPVGGRPYYDWIGKGAKKKKEKKKPTNVLKRKLQRKSTNTLRKLQRKN